MKRYFATFLFLLAAVALVICCDMACTLWCSRAPFMEKRQETAEDFKNLYLQIIELPENQRSYDNYRISENARFSKTALYLSGGKTKIPTAIVLAAKSRKDGSWGNVEHSMNPKVPMIFSFSLNYSNAYPSSPQETMICYSDGWIEFGPNPFLCEIQVEKWDDTNSQGTGELTIHFREDDQRFDFAKHYSELKIIIPKSM